MGRLVLVTDGLVLRDDFTRANSDTVGNGWTEPLLSESAAAVAILNNELHTTAVAAGIGRSSPSLPDDMIMQVNVETGNSIVFAKLGFRTNLLAVGAGSDDGYGVTLNEGGASLLIQETIAGSGNTRDTQARAYDNQIVGMRAITEVSGSDLIIRSGLTALLANLQDLTEDFDATTGTWTDTVTPFTEAEYFIFSNTALTDFDNFILCGRNVVVTNLPTGWKASIDKGVTKTTESGGTATIDVDTLALPRATVDVYDTGDVLQDRFSLTVVYGGASLNWDTSEVTAQVAPLAIGLNFRNAVGFVTDLGDEEFIGSAFPYPTTVGGVEMGWDQGWEQSIGTSDRDATVDRRLAGDMSRSNVQSEANAFRVDLGAGTYKIRIAAGSTTASSGHQQLALYDVGGTALINITEATGFLADEFWDASDVLRTEAAWPGSNVEVEITVDAGFLRFIIGGEGTGLGFSRINHLHIELVEAVAADGGTGGGTRGLVLRRRRRLYA